MLEILGNDRRAHPRSDEARGQHQPDWLRRADEVGGAAPL